MEPGKSRSEVFLRAYEALKNTRGKLIGVVLNKVKSRGRRYYRYGTYGHNDAKNEISSYPSIELKGKTQAERT